MAPSVRGDPIGSVLQLHPPGGLNVLLESVRSASQQLTCAHVHFLCNTSSRSLWFKMRAPCDGCAISRKVVSKSALLHGRDHLVIEDGPGAAPPAPRRLRICCSSSCASCQILGVIEALRGRLHHGSVATGWSFPASGGVGQSPDCGHEL